MLILVFCIVPLLSLYLLQWLLPSPYAMNLDRIDQIALLGFDDRGRDLFSRTIHAMTHAWELSVSTTLLAFTIATLVSWTAWIFPKNGKLLIESVLQCIRSIPALILVMIFDSHQPYSAVRTAFLIASYGSAYFYKQIKNRCFELSKSPFIENLTAIGLSPTRVYFEHVTGHTVHQTLPICASMISQITLALAGLQFFGFGPPSPEPTLGELLRQAYNYPGLNFLNAAPIVVLITIPMFGLVFTNRFLKIKNDAFSNGIYFNS